MRRRRMGRGARPLRGCTEEARIMGGMGGWVVGTGYGCEVRVVDGPLVNTAQSLARGVEK